MAMSAVPYSPVHCANCGTPFESKAKFCTNCGTSLGADPGSHSKLAPVNTAAGETEIHLKRALGLLKNVEAATDTLRERAIQHDARVDTDQPFVSGLLNVYKSASGLKREKQSLLSDLQLASAEVEKAAALDPEVVISVDSANWGIATFRATILYLSGQIEMIWGKPERAKEIWFEAIRIVDFAEPHYMLGLIYEDEYNPTEALKHFERCLDLDPAGDLSVPALREANAMKNYKKRFRGSWPLVLFMLLFFFPAAIVYFVVKYK